jgi:AcrR family transcriptional regulator
MPTRATGLAAATGPASGKIARSAARASAKGGNTAPADRRHAILQAATRRFAAAGFDATTVRQIADDVNILSGSLYHHFATKEDMLHEIVRDAVQQMRDNSIRIAQAPIDAEHRLVALILLDLGELTRNQEVHAILNHDRRFFRRKTEFAYVVKAKSETYQAWRSVLADGIAAKIFKPDLDLYLTIMTIIRMLNTAADWYKNDDINLTGQVTPYSLDTVIDFHLSFILSAVRLATRAAAPIPRQECELLARLGCDG